MFRRVTPQEVLDANVLDSANIYAEDGEVSFDAVIDEIDRFDDHGHGQKPPDDRGPVWGDRLLRGIRFRRGPNHERRRRGRGGRDNDSAGMDIIDGRPELDPVETLELTGVDDGSFVVQAFRPSTESGSVGPRIERTVDCGA